MVAACLNWNFIDCIFLAVKSFSSHIVLNWSTVFWLSTMVSACRRYVSIALYAADRPAMSLWLRYSSEVLLWRLISSQMCYTMTGTVGEFISAAIVSGVDSGASFISSLYSVLKN